MQVFWGEIAPCNHLVQIYDTDTVFMNSLEGFAGSGFLNNESVIIIATETHIKTLNERLLKQGFDLDKLSSCNQYIFLDANKCLQQFMVDGWPNDIPFVEFVGKIISKARSGNRKVRAFGEMVALLWETGNKAATIRLENLWSKYCTAEQFCLFCAYPKTGFTQDASTSMQDICASHSKIISGSANPTTEIVYRDETIVSIE